MDVAAYRAEAEAFSALLARSSQRFYSGREAALDLAPLYARYARLFDRKAVDALRARAAASGEDADQRLLAFAVDGHTARETAATETELARREGAATLRVDGADVPYTGAAAAQAAAADPARRARIEAARLELLVSELNPLHRERLELTHAVSRALGWPSHRARCEALTGVDLAGLGGEANTLLRLTRPRLEEITGAALAHAAGVSRDRVRRCDLPRLRRAPALDALFPPERLLGALAATLAGLRLDDGARPAIMLDADARSGKSARAFCAAVGVPGEVHLVVAPGGGRDDYAALLHEAGHAHHLAGTDPALGIESRRLGDPAVGEAFGFCFERLVSDPHWLDRRLGLSSAAAAGVAVHARAVRLLDVRRHAAKLGHELALHDAPADLDAIAGEYSRALGEATGVPWPRAPFLADVDPNFYTAAYLRGWALEAQLTTVLHERYGALWFEDPHAGAFLRELWWDGQRHDAETLHARLGAGRLDLTVLAGRPEGGGGFTPARARWR